MILFSVKYREAPMSLTLYYHPLSSFCWKALIALYETGAPFRPHLVELHQETSREEFLKVWPMGQFPVLHDADRSLTIPQSAIIIEYLSMHYAGKSTLFPADPHLALEARQWNEFFDDYIHVPMQKIVSDCIRPEGQGDAMGVAASRKRITTAYDVLEQRMKEREWAVGESFTIADCSASPALFYANKVEPLTSAHKSTIDYLERLKRRPSFARVLEEAAPYLPMFPYKG